MRVEEVYADVNASFIVMNHDGCAGHDGTAGVGDGAGERCGQFLGGDWRPTGSERLTTTPGTAKRWFAPRGADSRRTLIASSQTLLKHASTGETETWRKNAQIQSDYAI